MYRTSVIDEFSCVYIYYFELMMINFLVIIYRYMKCRLAGLFILFVL